VKATVALSSYTTESFDQNARTGFRVAVSTKLDTQPEAVAITSVVPASTLAAARRQLAIGGIDVKFTVTTVQQAAATAIQAKATALKQNVTELSTFSTELKVQIQAAGGAPPAGGWSALTIDVKEISNVVVAVNPVYAAANPTPPKEAGTTILFAAFAGIAGALVGTLMFKRMVRRSSSVAVIDEDGALEKKPIDTPKNPMEPAAELISLPLPEMSPPPAALPPIRHPPTRATLPPLIRTQSPQPLAGSGARLFEPLSPEELSSLSVDGCADRLVQVLDALVKAVASQAGDGDSKWLEVEAEALGARFESDEQMEAAMQQVRRRNAAARLEARMKARALGANTDTAPARSPTATQYANARLDEKVQEKTAQREEMVTQKLSTLKTGLKARFGDDDGE
jgi:hypothetical protein